MPTEQVLFERGLVPVELTAKDGLSLINGTSQMTAYAIIAHQELSSLLILADLFSQPPWTLVGAV